MPLMIVFAAVCLGIALLPEYTVVIHQKTGSLSAFEIFGHRIHLPVSDQIGRWWIGAGTPEEQLMRWGVLCRTCEWCALRVVAILIVVGLALFSRWPWEWQVPGVRRRAPWVVLSIATFLALAFATGANAMHYWLYGEYMSYGQVTDERGTLLFGTFATWIKIYSGVILAPIAEEILFRGWLQRMLTPICKVWPATILQAILFGVAHFGQGINGVAMTGSAGVALGLIFLYTGKLWPGILCHALINLYLRR
ncbi:MAG: CPBP family intramembrane metalloprotease [Verrucomicrobiae bacterium]|nr:CPBP family intramembrane metalloprotease [Verrucomicrobiae bacterium]